MMTDITRQESETKTLRVSERQLAQVIFNNSDGIIVADAEGIVRLVNPAAETLFGRDPGFIVGSLFGFPLVDVETTELDVVLQSGEPRIAEMRVTQTEWMEKFFDRKSFTAAVARVLKSCREKEV